MKKNIIIIMAIILIGGGCFYGGMKYSSAKGSAALSAGARNSQFQDFRNMTQEERQQRMREMGIDGDAAANRQGRVFMNGQGSGGFAAGEIISKDDSSITIKLGGVRNGENQGGTSNESGSKIIFFSESTKISKLAEGSADDLEIGKNISASGQANSDGTVAAETIQIRPEIE